MEKYRKTKSVMTMEVEDTSLTESETSVLSSRVKNLLCTFGLGKWPSDPSDDCCCVLQGQGDGKCNFDQVQAQAQTPIHVSVKEQAFVNQSGILNIEECGRCIHLDGDSPKDPCFYETAAFNLAPAFSACEKFWCQRSLEEFSLQCRHHLQWTGNPQLFLECFGILTERSESRNILALLLLCTGIEQALRNLFVVENESCPMLLKDILISREVENCIGKAATQILQVLLGPPISMNLRNVAWHGFLGEGEISPRYVYFLLVFITSLGHHKMSTAGVNESSIIQRQSVSLGKVDCIINALGLDLHEGVVERIREHVLDSWVACSRNKGLIQDVFDLHVRKEHGLSSVHGFPILEHALRRRFVHVNNCPHRLLTAEATALYTTYEEILDCHLPDGKNNRLVEDLGEPFMDLLHDLLIYPSGPRARDRLGHGEADVYHTPASLSLTIIVCLGYLAAKTTDGATLRKSDLLQPIQDVVSCVENYESLFHPVSELKGKILNLSLKSSQMHTCLRTDPTLQPWNPDDSRDVFIQDNSTFHSMVLLVCDVLCQMERRMSWDLSLITPIVATPFENVHDTISEALRPRVTTLHRWQKKAKCQEWNVSESEIINLMHRVVGEMSTVLLQMENALENRQDALDSRLLRSRQRNNTKHLILLFPNTVLGVQYLSIVCTFLFRLINQPDRGSSPLFKKTQKFLKSTLQLAENVRTLTSKENNKWLKAEEILVVLVKTGLEFVQ